VKTRPSRRLRLALAALPAVVLVALLAVSSFGAAAGVLAAIATGLAFMLAARLESPEERAAAGRVANGLLLALPVALIVGLSFNAGGFFEEAPALFALGVAVLLLLRIVLARDPFEGVGRLVVIAVGSLALFAGWSLLSARWSHAPGRAFGASERALLYLLVLALFGSIGRTNARLRWLIRSVVLGIVVVCTCALITRVLPHVWPIRPNVVNNRLSYPITYWNTLGLLAAIGCILSLHLTSSLREPAPVRIVAAAVLPLLATTLLFTFSRGAVAACAIGLVAYVLLGHPRGLLPGLISVVPPTVIALITAYHADLLAKPNPTTAAAVAQGRHVAIVVGLCILGAAVLRGACLPLDGRLWRYRPSRSARSALRVALGAGALALIVAALAAGVPHRIHDDYSRFVNNVGPRGGSQDFRQRLTDPSNNGRLAFWKVSVRQFRGSRLHGGGAGTFELAWSTDRPASYSSAQVVNAHSLYVETLGELGIVGLVLLAGALGAIFVGVIVKIRGPSRSLYAASFAALLAWALDAGVDWQWQMPVVTTLVFAIGGLAIARPAGSGARRAGPALRVGGAMACAALAVIPLLLAISQAHLDNSVAAFKRQDCPKAESAARASLAALGSRAEPYQVLGYCAIQDGHPQAAVADVGKAVKRDPRNWEYRYSLAVALASAGEDPQPALSDAMRLGPFQVLPDDGAVLFRTRDPSVWRRRAPLAPLPDELAS
jgi:O-Antigen ligase